MVKINFFKSIIVKIKHRSPETTRNLARDWALVLLVFCFTYGLAAYLCWQLNQAVANGGAPAQKAAEAPVALNRTAIDKVVNFYKNQEDLFNQNKNAAVVQADPSK